MSGLSANSQKNFFIIKALAVAIEALQALPPNEARLRDQRAFKRVLDNLVVDDGELVLFIGGARAALGVSENGTLGQGANGQAGLSQRLDRPDEK